MSMLTHEELLNRRRKGLFVGREAERRAFRQNFEGEFPETLYFYIHGQGGIGKSFLVARYQTIAREQGARTALTTEAEATAIRQDSIVQAMERLSDELCEEGHPLLPTFAARCARYRECMRQVAADKNAPQGILGRLGWAVTKAAAGAAGETVIGSAVIAGGLELAGTSEEGLAQRVDDVWGEYLARRFRRNKEDLALVREPVETLTPLFVGDVNKLAAKQPVVLCFDTWERTGDHLGEWLRSLPHQGLSANVWLVIAGRHPLGDEWESMAPLMAVYELETFSEEETRDYLRRQGITEEARVREILDFAGGVPVLVSTLASARGGNASEAAHSLVERYLKWVDDPLRRQIALHCAAARRLNLDIVAALVGEDEASSLFDWLIEMPFVQSRPGYWEYHPKVRERMLQYAHSRSNQECKDVHGKLCVYHRDRLVDLGADECYQDPAGRQHMLEALYHSLMGQQSDAVRGGLEMFLLSLRRYYPLAGEVVVTWKQAIAEGTARHGSAAWADTLETLWTAIEGQAWAQLLPAAKVLAGEKDLSDRAGVEAFLVIGLGHHGQGEWKQAVEDYGRAIELDPEYAAAYYNRGNAYRHLNDYERAIEDYTRAIERNPEDAAAYTFRGAAYAELHDYERAIQDWSRSIELDPGDTRVYYGMSCVYALTQDTTQACEWLERAIALDEEWRQEAREDADFDGIREDERFQALVAEPGSHGAEPPC